MFLGWGLSVDGMTVAVIAWDTLFLKADSESAPYFIEEGCRIFEYTGKGRVRRMGYYTAPEASLESPEAMRPWAGRAMQAALAAKRRKRPIKRAAKRT